MTTPLIRRWLRPSPGRVALALAALALPAALCATRAEAGIVVLKNGKVFIGRFDTEDVKDQVSLTIHSPRLKKGGPPVRGEQTIPWHEIRWHNKDADELTDDYCQKYFDEEIDQAYKAQLQAYKDRKEAPILFAPIDLKPKLGGGLSAIPVPTRWGQDEVTIRKPSGWSSNKVGDILIFESDEKPTEGFRAQIHLYAVDAAVGQVSDQLNWIREEVSKLATGADNFVVSGDSTTPKMGKGGRNEVELVTSTRRKELSVKALRKVYWGQNRTFFVTCYAHDKDFERLLLLYRACVGTLSITEAGTPVSGDQIDVTTVVMGQTYRWKSATVPDELTWEIIAKEAGIVRHRTLRSGADGSKKTTEESEQLAPIDPVARLATICSSPVSPVKVGRETLTVSGTAFDCDIFEATPASGKKHKLWIARKFPNEVKLMVDGVVARELAEIK